MNHASLARRSSSSVAPSSPSRLRALAALVPGLALLAVSVSACAPDAEEPAADAEYVASTTDELVTRTSTGKVFITPDELAHPGTGCFVTNPTCALNPGASLATPTRESWVLSLDACLARAAEWSVWCGNGSNTVSSAAFQIRGDVVKQVTSRPANDTRCIVNLPVCRKAPQSVGRFGDAFGGADGVPARCSVRAAEYHQWCANLPGDRVVTSFENRGAVQGVWAFPR